MLYGREATNPSILGYFLVEQDKVFDPVKAVRELVKWVIDIQATAYSTAYKIKTLELTPSNAFCSPVTEFQVEDQVLYYQNYVVFACHPPWVNPQGARLLVDEAAGIGPATLSCCAKQRLLPISVFVEASVHYPKELYHMWIVLASSSFAAFQHFDNIVRQN
ncbi:hypothetical protein DSO57_1024289 [Entomophthora muscae]|uniref:Uncharacterized protein n=1 Tax=Entomophthora muscae TaxID=34485 RepID=A0ACC2TPW3_9FUNG|nr:hypothetical protein DSO57_1024289 [Entomophthora muscae]